jgi:Co/Zn/Cd efflux system component
VENDNNFGYEKITILVGNIIVVMLMTVTVITVIPRNNKQRVVLGQKRKCQRVEESEL